MIPAGVLGSAHVDVATKTLTFQTSVVSTGSSTTFLFSSVAIGTASSTRRVIVATSKRSASQVTAVTIGGVSATRDVRPSGTPTSVCEIWSAVVPTGTTASIQVTWQFSGTTGCGIAVWTLSSGSPTGNTATTTSGGAMSMSVTTTSGDVVVAGIDYNSSSAHAASWTAGTSRADDVIHANDAQQTVADTVATGTSTSLSCTISPFTDGSAVAAAYA